MNSTKLLRAFLAQTPRLPGARHPSMISPTIDTSRAGLLRKLKGQEIHIPNLHNIFTDWPYDTNSRANIVESSIQHLITVHTYSDNVRHRLQKAQLSSLLAGWYPYAGENALAGLTSFVAWMFVVDDVIDGYAQRGQIDRLEILNAECSDYIHRSLKLSSPSPPPVYTEPSVSAFADCGQILSSRCSKALRQRFAREISFTLDCYRQELNYRSRGHIPTAGEYLAYRVGSSCTMQMTAMIEFANDLRLPDEIMDSREVRQVYEAEAHVQWLTNDIVSVHKEMRQGFVENLVVLLADGDAQRGMDRTVDLLREAKARLDDTSAVLLSRHGSGEHAQGVELIARNCKAMCTGNLVWSLNSPRYDIVGRLQSDGSAVLNLW